MGRMLYFFRKKTVFYSPGILEEPGGNFSGFPDFFPGFRGVNSQSPEERKVEGA
jgi:hypothetical protein